MRRKVVTQLVTGDAVAMNPDEMSDLGMRFKRDFQPILDMLENDLVNQWKALAPSQKDQAEALRLELYALRKMGRSVSMMISRKDK